MADDKPGREVEYSTEELAEAWQKTWSIIER
jgi:hypothetical protein